MTTKAQREAAAAKKQEQADAEALAALSPEELAALAELSEEEVAALSELAPSEDTQDDEDAEEPEADAEPVLSGIQALDAAQADLGSVLALYSHGKATQLAVDEAQAKVDQARAAIRG